MYKEYFYHTIMLLAIILDGTQNLVELRLVPKIIKIKLLLYLDLKKATKLEVLIDDRK